MNNAVKVTASNGNDELTSAVERIAPPVSSSEAKLSHRPLIAHIIYRLDVGGLENGLVNLINRTLQYQHAIICMTDYTDFSRRITHPAVSLYSLDKQEGKDFGVYVRLWGLLRRLRPDIVHTRNLAALVGQLRAGGRQTGDKCGFHDSSPFTRSANPSTVRRAPV